MEILHVLTIIIVIGICVYWYQTTYHPINQLNKMTETTLNHKNANYIKRHSKSKHKKKMHKTRDDVSIDSLDSNELKSLTKKQHESESDSTFFD